MSTGAAQCDHLDIVLQQVVANQAAQGGATRDDCDTRERLLAAEVAARGRGCPMEKVGPSTALDSLVSYPPWYRRFVGRHSSFREGVGQRHGSGGRPAPLD